MSPAPAPDQQHDASVPLLQALPEGIPVAQLQTVDFKKLQEGDEHEASTLFSTCCRDGFFYLDLRSAAIDISSIADGIYALTKDLYDLDEEVKMRYDTDKISDMKINGYKPMGRNYGGIDGKRDGFETYAIPHDGVMGIGELASFAHPAVIDEHMETLRSFTQAVIVAHEAVLASLSASLGLMPGGRLQDCHRMTVPGQNIVRLLKYHAQPPHERGESHTAHTDLGTLTMLFTRQPGLQVLSRIPSQGQEEYEQQWSWVQPREGCAIVNLGDGMARLTNGLFHSCLHRVGPLPDRAMDTRYSFAYLSRAEADTPMTGLQSPLIPAADPEAKVYTSAEWLGRKFGQLRLETHKKGADQWILTGRKEAIQA